MNMRGKRELTDFLDSSTTLADERKAKWFQCRREMVLEKVSEVLEKSLNFFEKFLYCMNLKNMGKAKCHRTIEDYLAFR